MPTVGAACARTRRSPQPPLFGWAKTVIQGPRSRLGNGAPLTRRRCRTVSCKMAPNSGVGRTGKHFCRTASAVSRYLDDISFGTTFVCRNHGRASKLADRANHEPQHDGGSDSIGRDGPARRQVSSELLPGVDACSLAPARLGLALSSLLQLPCRDPAPRRPVEGGDTRQRCDLARAWRLASCASKDPARLRNLRRRRSWVDGGRVPNV